MLAIGTRIARLISIVTYVLPLALAGLRTRARPEVRDAQEIT